MIEKEDLIQQIVYIWSQLSPWGETKDELYQHFLYELNNDLLATIEVDGKVVAFVDWAWVSSMEDIRAIDSGAITSGDMLLVMNVWCSNPSYFWKLKGLLPKHRYICWQVRGDFDKVHAPFGWPIQQEVMQ